MTMKLQPGDKAPEFEAITEANETVRLSDFRGKKVILYFYPKDNTSGCTTQACSFRDSYAELEAQNAVVLGVSPDGIKSHQKFRAKHELPFSLLVDSDHGLASTYSVWGEKSMYGKTYMGIIRSHFVIDESGRIVDARYKISPKKSAALAVAALD
jgi:peroxiredoxin Q/BCP